jgi:hypothetical protein
LYTLLSVAKPHFVKFCLLSLPTSLALHLFNYAVGVSLFSYILLFYNPILFLFLFYCFQLFFLLILGLFHAAGRRLRSTMWGKKNFSYIYSYFILEYLQLSCNVLGNWRFFVPDKENTKYFTGTKKCGGEKTPQRANSPTGVFRSPKCPIKGILQLPFVKRRSNYLTLIFLFS